MYDCLTMKHQERVERHRENLHHIKTHTARMWADTFISELNDCQIEAHIRNGQSPPLLHLDLLSTAYHTSEQRLFVLGYNATLTTSVDAPRPPRLLYDKMRQLARLHPTTIRCIRDLCEDEMNTVMIFSGSERRRMDEQFRGLPVWLIAENGVYMKPPVSVVVDQI